MMFIVVAENRGTAQLGTAVITREGSIKFMLFKTENGWACTSIEESDHLPLIVPDGNRMSYFEFCEIYRHVLSCRISFARPGFGNTIGEAVSCCF
jgi:hypothetical protein